MSRKIADVFGLLAPAGTSFDKRILLPRNPHAPSLGHIGAFAPFRTDPPHCSCRHGGEDTSKQSGNNYVEQDKFRSCHIVGLRIVLPNPANTVFDTYP